MEYFPKLYTSVPPKDELERILQTLIEAKGPGPWKVGATTGEKVISRYSGNGVYKKINQDNLLCKFSTNEDAINVEGKIKERLVVLGMCANQHNDHCPGVAGKADDYVVYFVQMNNELRLCPLLNCGTVLIASAIDAHIDNHDYLKSLKQWKAIHHAKADNTLDELKTEPLVYHHDAYKADYCRYCKIPWPKNISMNRKQYHLSTCSDNPMPFFKCRECGVVCDRKRLLDRHNQKHAKERKQRERKFEFVCQHCQKSFKVKWNRDAHEKLCKMNPAEREIYFCARCNTPFKAKYKCIAHQKKCTLSEPKRQHARRS